MKKIIKAVNKAIKEYNDYWIHIMDETPSTYDLAEEDMVRVMEGVKLVMKKRAMPLVDDDISPKELVGKIAGLNEIIGNLVEPDMEGLYGEERVMSDQFILYIIVELAKEPNNDFFVEYGDELTLTRPLERLYDLFESAGDTMECLILRRKIEDMFQYIGFRSVE